MLRGTEINFGYTYCNNIILKIINVDDEFFSIFVDFIDNLARAILKLAYHFFKFNTNTDTNFSKYHNLK